MIHVYAYRANSYTNSYFLFDPTTNLRTPYTGDMYRLARKPFEHAIDAKTNVYDPSCIYSILAIESVRDLPNKEELLSTFKNLYPEVFI